MFEKTSSIERFSEKMLVAKKQKTANQSWRRSPLGPCQQLRRAGQKPAPYIKCKVPEHAIQIGIENCQINQSFINRVDSSYKVMNLLNNSRMDCQIESPGAGASTKEFQLCNVKVSYENKSQVLPTEQGESREVVVRNYVCKKIDNVLKKRTEIVIGRKLIVLQDLYIFSDQGLLQETSLKSCADSETSACESSQKNKDQEVDLASLEAGKRDKKNVVKNIVKAYETWLKNATHAQDNQSYQEAKKALASLLETLKFNNHLVNAILANKELNSTFQEFLSTQATKWLNCSKIKDRVSHQETIDLYRRSCTLGKLQRPNHWI